MATEQQLTVTIATVADLAGAQQVQNALQQTQNVGRQSQQTLTAQQQAVNQMLRQSMQGQPQTLSAFSRELERVAQATTIRPTLLPADFGIQAAAANAALRATATVTREVGEASSLTGNELGRMGAAFVGLGVGLSAFTAAGQIAHQAIASIIDDTIALDQAQRSNTAALGSQAQSFQQWATTVSQQSGQTEQALLKAGTAAAQFGRQAGLGPEATQQLTAVATVLASIQGTDVSTTMTQLSAALSGNAQAAQALNLQLDAGYVAFTQLGGATSDVFDLLDPSTQKWLSYQSALGQVADQIPKVIGPVSELQKAQGDLNVQWENFVQTTGPGVVGALAGILSGANTAATAIGNLNAQTLEHNRLSGMSDEGFKNEGAALDALGRKVRDFLNTPAGEPFRDLVDNPAVQEWVGRVGDGFSQIGQEARDVADAVGGVTNAVQSLGTAYTGAADQADRVAASAAHTAQVEQVAGQVANIAAARDAARGNELTAAEAITRYRQEQVNLGADEARIRLSMLPTTQRMLELTNETTEAQIRAQQATLPSSRAQQDLQNQIRLNTLMAQNADLGMDQRQQALATATALTRRVPGVETAALQAQIAATPAQRAAQDVQTQAQLQSLQLQRALMPDQFQVDRLTLLSQIADAAKQAATRDVKFDNTQINIMLQTAKGAGELTDQDVARLSEQVGVQVATQFHQAVQSVNNRGAPPQLMAATGPS
jgi:hypothetical protein